MSSATVRWVLVAVMVALVVALLAYARGEPGGLGRELEGDEVGLVVGHGVG